MHPPTARRQQLHPIADMNLRREGYERRIIEVEHDSFTPIIFSTSGGWGPSATVAFRRLAGLLSDKLSQPHSRTLGLLRCKAAFSLLDSTIMWLRGARSSFHNLLWWSVGMVSLWTSLQVRPGCQIHTDLLLLLFANTIITINTVPMYFTFCVVYCTDLSMLLWCISYKMEVAVSGYADYVLHATVT